MTELVTDLEKQPRPNIPATVPTVGRVPHFRYPFQVTTRGVATVEQDTVEEVTQCVYGLFATEVGSRQEEPDFGVTDQAFRQNGADLEELEAVAGTWEPRASLLNEVAWDQLVETVTTEVSANE